MKEAYEYVWFIFDIGDLGTLNKFSRNGWRVVYTEQLQACQFGTHRSLLERKIEN
jgi:hypothetical protein